MSNTGRPKTLNCCLQVADQARRLVALEEALKEARLRPMARRRCLEGGEADPVASLERQLASVTQELEVGPEIAQGCELRGGTSCSPGCPLWGDGAQGSSYAVSHL